MADSLALVWDLIARDGASPTFARVGAAADSTAGSVKKLAAGFGLLAAGGVVAASVKAAADFQKQMLLVQTQAGATAQEVANMSPKILALAGQVAQAPEALATSLYHVESTGLRGAAAIDAVRVAAEGAKVGNADLEQTTNALTATIASGMLPATETYSQAMGQLNTIVGSGDMKMQDLNDSLSTGLLVTVKQYGVTLNDVGAALADFGDNNIRGEDAATRLRMAVQAIAKPGVDAAAALGRIGLTVQQLQSDEQTGGLNKALTDLHTHLVNSGIDATQWGALLTDAFTKKAGAGMVTLIGTFDRFQQKYQEVSKGADSFGTAWQATTKTASFQFSQLKDTVDALGIQIGTHLLPVAGDLAQWLSQTGIPDLEKFGTGLGDVAKWFSSLPGPVKDFALALAAVKAIDMIGWLQPVIGGIRALGSGAGTMSMQVRTAFAEAKAAQLDLMGSGGLGGTLVSRATGNLAGLGAAAGEVASGGFSALRAAGSNLVDFLGGPWGVGFAAAGAVLPAVISGIKFLTGNVIDAKVAQEDFTNALQATNGVMDASIKKNIQEQLTKAGVIDTFRQAGISAQDAIAGIEGNAAAQQRVDDALQTYMEHIGLLHAGAASQRLDVKQAIDAYNQLSTAFSGGKAAADYFSGGAQNADDKTVTFTGAIKTLIGAINSVPAMHVTADTTAAQNTINAFLQQAQAQGFVGAIFNLKPIGSGGNGGNPIGFPPVPGRAGGGPITGPGTGTSDSILIAASNNEHMWTAAEVAAAGGHGAVEAMRRSVLAGGFGFAGGGPVIGYPVDWNQTLKNAWAGDLRQAQAVSMGATGLGGSLAKLGVQALVQAMAAQRGWGSGAEWNALAAVINRESGWNPNAANPTSSARGLFQKMTSINGPLESTLQGQTNWGLNYIGGRYGDPLGAWRHEQQFGWYDNGGWLMPGVTMAYNGTGRPERVLGPQHGSASDVSGRSAPLVGEVHVHSEVDLDLVLQQAEFRQRSGAFS